MRIMETRVFLIEKRNDYLREFWKYTTSEFTEVEFIRLLRFFESKRKVIPFSDYSGNAKLILWNKNEYTELFIPGVMNIEGCPWPKRLSDITFFPMANIKTEEDIKRYNSWRVNFFRRHIIYLQNYFKWVPLSCREEAEEWKDIIPDLDITPLFPTPLTLRPAVVKFLRRKLDEGTI